MGQGKQARVLSKHQVEAVYSFLGTRRNGLRDQTIFLLSIRSGLRAKEIAQLRWSMVIDTDGTVGDMIHLTDAASKGKSGRSIPLNKQLRRQLEDLLEVERKRHRFDRATSYVIATERRAHTSAQAIVNKFHLWYRDMGLLGCSSHSGRRTFITNAARKITTVGGSLRDVQSLAGHSSLQTTQRYIEINSEARRKIVDMI
jgi:integrase